MGRGRGRKRRYPWGDERTSDERANLDQLALRHRRRPAPIRTARAPAAPQQMVGRRLGVDGQRLRAPTPASRRSRTASTRRPFFGGPFKVLRGGSWATQPDAVTTHLPQLGLSRAAPDLRRLSLRPRRRDGEASDGGARSVGSSADAPGDVAIDVHLRDGALATLADDVRAGLSRSRRSFRRSTSTTSAGRGSSSRSRACPSTTRRAPSRRSSIASAREIVDDGRARGAGRARPGIGAQDARAARPDGRAAARRGTYVPVDVSESAVRELAARLAGAYEGLRDPRRRRRLRAGPGAPATTTAAGGWSPSSAARSATSTVTSGARSCGGRATLLGPDDRLLIGTDLVKDTASARGRLQRLRRRDRRVQPQRPARHQREPRRRPRPGPLRPRRLLRRAASSGSRCGCARASRTAARIDALDMDVEFERGEDIRTEISCKFTRAGLAREYAAAGPRAVAWYTDERGPVRALADRPGLAPADAAIAGAALSANGASSTGGDAYARPRPRRAAPRRSPVRDRQHGRERRRPGDARRAQRRDLERDRPASSSSTLRTQVDAVMAGTGDDRDRALRAARARAPSAASGAGRGGSSRCRSRSRRRDRWSCRCRRRCSRTRARASSC